MIRFYHKNRHRINGLRKHGSRDFEKPFDRKKNYSEKYKSYFYSLEMAFPAINYDFSGTDWLLRPPLASAIYFAIALEYVMAQFSFENHSSKHISTNVNQSSQLEINFSGILIFFDNAKYRLQQLCLECCRLGRLRLCNTSQPSWRNRLGLWCLHGEGGKPRTFGAYLPLLPPSYSVCLCVHIHTCSPTS